MMGKEIEDYNITSVEAHAYVGFNGSTSLIISWNGDMGFGMTNFKFLKSGKVELGSGCMSKNFVKAVLHKLVDDATVD